MQKSIISPRLVQLQQDLEAGNTWALDDFWQEIVTSGTPLIEACSDDKALAFVTFLWKDKGDTQKIIIFNGPTPWRNPTDNQLVRFLNTNLWYKTYIVRSDMRTIYYFSHNDPLEFDEVKVGGNEQ